MMDLDSVKSRARRHAWKIETKWDEFNPFSRVSSRESGVVADPERAVPEHGHGETKGQIGSRRPPFTETHSTGCLDDANGGPANTGMKHSNTFPSESPTSTTDVESSGGAAAEYYRGGNDESATTLNGDVDSINQSGIKKRNALNPVNEESAVTTDEDTQQIQLDTEKVSEETDEGDEEEKKRQRDEVLKRKIPFQQQMKTVLFPKWLTINWLLIAAPVGIGLHFSSVNPLAIFIINFIAIIPLAGILSFATEEIAIRVGEVLGGLLNASFG